MEVNQNTNRFIKKRIKHKISIDFQLQNDVGTFQELSDLCDKDVYLEIVKT